MTTPTHTNGVVHAPHQPLTDYYPDESARAGFVRGMFDSTAGTYDRIERILAFGSGVWYRGQALRRAGLREGHRIVDIGIGTGLVAREAVKIVGAPNLLVGVDPSPGMLERARAAVPAEVQLIEGTAEAIPFPDASFDFLSMGYALRHIGDLAVAFREFHRVLKPGGRLCLLEITKPETAVGRMLLKAYMRGIVPTLARLVGAGGDTVRLWRYYWDTIEACAPPEQVVATLRAAGFVDARRYIDQRPMPIFAEFQARKPG
jgi:demethylmenaquinone methyltransferase / 2-methoxy-6-polyprenyl-1,4-benzoquinol methylase